jgi:GNAT superfamily N-acetyltransferase
MKIINSTKADIDMIYRFYDDAISYQKKMFNRHWLGFDRSLIETEIQENRQWKVMINDEVACIFAITFNDATLWKEKDQQPSLYLHRIVTLAQFRGAGFVKSIIEWAKQYGKDTDKEFVRLDTWSDNKKLVDYYMSSGFRFIETVHLEEAEGLPAHYKGSLALLEIKIE